MPLMSAVTQAMGMSSECSTPQAHVTVSATHCSVALSPRLCPHRRGREAKQGGVLQQTGTEREGGDHAGWKHKGKTQRGNMKVKEFPSA